MNGRRALFSLCLPVTLLVACGGGDASSTGAADRTADETDALSTAGTSDLDIISPVSGSTVPSPAWARAHMTTCNGSKPTSFGYSVDSDPTIIAGVTLADVDTTVALSAGSHSFHYKAWSAGGLCMGSTTFTVGGTAVADGITVTAPANGATVSSPVTIDATVATCGGVKATAFGYSVDDASAITWGSATSVATSDSTLSPGAHTLRFKAWGGSTLCPVIDRAVTVTGVTGAPDAGGGSGTGYDGSSTIPEPPTGAALYANLDDLTGWSAATGAASQCPNGVASPTCDPVSANYDTTVGHVTDPGTEPAGGNDKAGLFQLYSGPKNATAIWGHSFATSTTARNFIWDFQIYVDATDYQNSELDFYQILDGQRFMMGTQCDRGQNSWDTWNEETQHWVVNSQIHCQDILGAGAWHHVVMYLSTDSTKSEYTYHTLRIDEVDYPLGQTQPGKPSSWPNGLIGVQVQLDANNSGSAVNEYIDGMKTYAW
jgi:hypothetical protein